MSTNGSPGLRLKRLGINTYRELVIYLNAESPVCRSEGFEVRSRVSVRAEGKTILATLNTVDTELLAIGEVSLSEAAWKALDAQEGDLVHISHATQPNSESSLRKKVYGSTLSAEDIDLIVNEISMGLYDDIHLAAFITACAGDRLSESETLALTRSMVSAGKQLSWPSPIVADKHCIGGLPGNRTSMIVVPIIAAAGLVIPKTSSRAITSPAGTADAMETLTNVELNVTDIYRIVEREGGCIAWGGTVQLSPADDILIGIERPLDFDSAGQLVASVLSKKIAAGSSHVVIDMPIGPTAKLRTIDAANRLEVRLQAIARKFGIRLRIIKTDGSQPVGQGIGPSLEARDVLKVLQNTPDAPKDLALRAVMLSGELFELAGAAGPGLGHEKALQLLHSGKAWQKFQAICEAQGGMKLLKLASYRSEVRATKTGKVISIDNRKLAKLAKLAGAPHDSEAGVDFHAPLGTLVMKGFPLLTVHARTPGELQYALDYARSHPEIVLVGEPPL